MAIILDGKAVAAQVKADLAERVQRLRAHGVVPGLGTVLVGEDAGSVKYVAGKHKDCEEIGIASIRHDLPADTTQEELLDVVDALNADPACTGYIVQLPLPQGMTPMPSSMRSTRPRTPMACTRSISANSCCIRADP